MAIHPDKVKDSFDFWAAGGDAQAVFRKRAKWGGTKKGAAPES
jgi:hypothetical protein